MEGYIYFLFFCPLDIFGSLVPSNASTLTIQIYAVCLAYQMQI